MGDMSWEDYKVNVPEGVSGDWSIEKFTVTQEESDFDRMRSAFSFGSRVRYCPAGDYTALKRQGTIIMSDTRDEIFDHYTPIRKAHGNCLINGLGLGVITNAMLSKDSVTHVTVVEISPDVIALVEPWMRSIHGDRLTVINADAMEWKPKSGSRFGAVWHDIWDNICDDNIEDMKTLHRRYGRRCEWQGSWCRSLLTAQEVVNEGHDTFDDQLDSMRRKMGGDEDAR